MNYLNKEYIMPKNNKIKRTTPDFVIYETDNSVAKVSVRLEEETVWLTQANLADLFQTSRPNVTMHIKNILEEGELQEISVCKDFLHTASDGKNYNTKYYNLDMIISLGYRINSKVATKFRQWATERLKEYIVKGFTLDDERLKNALTRHCGLDPQSPVVSRDSCFIKNDDKERRKVA
jgi:hypothetical protein